MPQLTRRELLKASVGVASAVAVASSTGCAAQGSSAGASRHLAAAISAEPDKLDPNTTTSYNSFQVLENVFDTLVEPDENLQMQPALAQSWQASSDELTWSFTLAEGVTWHDGTEFSSADVVYTLKRIIDGELPNAYRFGAVEDVSAPDPGTVVITLSEPSPNLLTNLGAFKGVAIVQQANVESGAINTRPVGTGPFSLASYSQGDSITLAANETYFRGAPAVSGVTFRFMSEPNTALSALRAGDIQWTDVVPPQQVGVLQDEDGVELGSTLSNDYWYLSLNQSRAPWNDVRVRQAIAYAIDRSAIAQATHFGHAQVNQLAIPKSNPFYVEYSSFSTDREKAKALMAEAGVPQAQMNFLATNEYPETITVAQLLADLLQHIGVEVTITTVDFATWLAEQGEGNYDMLMMGWLGNIDPDDFYFSQLRSDGANNYQHYANAQVDELLDRGRVETDFETRKQIYADAARIIADECGYIFLYNPEVVQAYSPSLSGYTVRGDRAIRFREAALS